MPVDTNGRDTIKDRYKPKTVNFALQGATGLWQLLTDDNDIGKIKTLQRNQVQTFLETEPFPITHVKILWQGADPILGRIDQLEVRVVKRQGNSLAVIAHYLSAPFAGFIGANNTMIVPFVNEQPDRFPEEAFIGGYIKSLSDTPDPGQFLIDRVLLVGGSIPATTATIIP